MKTNNQNPTALIFHRNLLPKSETFVLAQASNLRRFNPYYAGIQHTGGLALPKDRLCAMAGRGFYGAAMARCFKLTGISPRFLAKLQRTHPVLMHAHFEESGMAALPLTRALNIPLITTFHGYDATANQPDSGPRRMLNKVYARQRRRLQREGNLFVAVSEFIRQKLIERGYPEDRITTLPIGVDVETFSPQRGEPATPMVLFVGRMVEKKGVAYLLQAMVEVTKQRQHVRLVLIGEGPLMPALKADAHALKLTNVTFMGACDLATVRQQMSQATMLAAPSVTAASGDSEGLPIVVCEAQAMGLPVVGTYHAGIPEIVRHEVNGFLVRERSVQELATCILRLLNKPDLCHAMGLAARANVCRNFNLKVQNERLEEWFETVVGQHAKGKASQ